MSFDSRAEYSTSLLIRISTSGARSRVKDHDWGSTRTLTGVNSLHELGSSPSRSQSAPPRRQPGMSHSQGATTDSYQQHSPSNPTRSRSSQRDSGKSSGCPERRRGLLGPPPEWSCPGSPPMTTAGNAWSTLGALSVYQPPQDNTGSTGGTGRLVNTTSSSGQAQKNWYNAVSQGGNAYGITTVIKGGECAPVQSKYQGGF